MGKNPTLPALAEENRASARADRKASTHLKQWAKTEDKGKKTTDPGVKPASPLKKINQSRLHTKQLAMGNSDRARPEETALPGGPRTRARRIGVKIAAPRCSFNFPARLHLRRIPLIHENDRLFFSLLCTSQLYTKINSSKDDASRSFVCMYVCIHARPG